MIAVSRRTGTIVGAVVLVAAFVVGITVYRVKEPTTASAGSTTSATSTGTSPTDDPSSTKDPSSTDDADETDESDEETTDDFPTDDGEFPPGELPGDLTPNAVEDECLLTASEFEILTGQSSLRAENTELAGDGRRSCFYGPSDPESDDPPAGRVDVYSSASLTPPDLVARIAANSSGSRALAGVGSGAVVVASTSGTSELVVASPTLLVVLTLLPDAVDVPPADDAWTAAGAAMIGRLPA